jgi:hypothetical protein
MLTDRGEQLSNIESAAVIAWSFPGCRDKRPIPREQIAWHVGNDIVANRRSSVAIQSSCADKLLVLTAPTSAGRA